VVRRVLDRRVAESPYLARQLSVFDNRQLATGVPEAMFERLQRTQNSTVTQRDEQFILVWALFRVIAFTSSRGVVFLRWIDRMIVCTRGCIVSLFI
jgi:hypothetical protein